MNLLLDTHILLWAVNAPERLSSDVRNLLEHVENTLFFSAASLWEITIKQGLGRTDFQVNAQALHHALLDHDYKELVITGEHVIAVANLPVLHKDPFDRLLIAQATTEAMLLLTADTLVAGYPGPIRRV